MSHVSTTSEAMFFPFSIMSFFVIFFVSSYFTSSRKLTFVDVVAGIISKDDTILKPHEYAGSCLPTRYHRIKNVPKLVLGVREKERKSSFAYSVQIGRFVPLWEKREDKRGIEWR